MRAEDLTAVVITSVADAIGLEKNRFHRESTLIGDLGAASIDLLDMWFRIHRDSGVEISGADVAALLQGVSGNLVTGRTGLRPVQVTAEPSAADSYAIYVAISSEAVSAARKFSSGVPT